MSHQVTIGDYLLTRLKELGIQQIFGVPGDYNLGFLDQVVNHPSIEWIGNCNELNGAYAADGYARIKGAGALVTTFGVGELSAINGIAGSYAEFVPVVQIVGIPSTTIQANKALVHHLLGHGRFTIFSEMYKNITVAQVLLTQSNAAKEIDRVLTECWLEKRPVYIGLPADICNLEIEAPKEPLNLTYPASNPDALNEVIERVRDLLHQSTRPVALIDLCARQHFMKPRILDFLYATGIPFASMNMGKAIINESNPQYIGNYNGDFSSGDVQKQVEQSDCLITFGTFMTDFNTGDFTAKLNTNATVEIFGRSVRVKQSSYPDVTFHELIPALTKKISYRYKGKIAHPELGKFLPQPIPLTQKRFWSQMANFLPKKAIILAETGTSMFGAAQMLIPDHSTYICQGFWCSIGYTVGALLGACTAAPDRPGVLFVGDGSFQLTAQEISTILRNRFNPTIFLLDNDGYTVERMIHGPKMVYNDIQHWHYADLPKIFGDNVWSTTVSTEKELADALLERLRYQDKMAFIQVMLEKMDAPESLIKIGEHAAIVNQYTEKV